MAGLFQCVAQPLESLVQSITGSCDRRLNELQVMSTYEAHIDWDQLTQARRVRECKPSLSVISEAFIAF